MSAAERDPPTCPEPALVVINRESLLSERAIELSLFINSSSCGIGFSSWEVIFSTSINYFYVFIKLMGGGGLQRCLQAKQDVFSAFCSPSEEVPAQLRPNFCEPFPIHKKRKWH
jgi:hypothetical protein